jgi:hypothetical protein
MRRVILLFTSALLAMSIAVQAQDAANTLADWVPESFAGFVSLNTEDIDVTVEALNVAAFTASVLQPTRFQFAAQNGLDGWFPLDSLDLERATFAQLIAPWLGGELVVAWPDFNDQFVSSGALMLLSTRDAFTAASAMSPVVRGQDFLQQESYQGATLYLGDRTALAFTPAVVLIGPLEHVRAALDVQAGDSDSITADETFNETWPLLDSDALARIFVQDEAAAGALNFVLNGGFGADVVAAYGGALAAADDEALLAVLAAGGIEAAAVSVGSSLLISNGLDVSAVLATAADISLADAEEIGLLWSYVPRSAIVAAGGSDAGRAAESLLYGLPLVSFLPRALAAFPFDPNAPSGGDFIPLPEQADITAVVDGFIATLERIGGIDLTDDVLDEIDGGYLAALLPRPNNPAPLLNASFDVLLAAESRDAADLAETLTRVAEQFLGEGVLVADGDIIAFSDPLGGDTVFAIAAPADADVLLVGTGEAVAQAIRAGAGDNQLVAQERWAVLAEQLTPDWYFDIPGIYNLIAPSTGGQGQTPILQVGLAAEQHGERLVQIHLRVGLNLD